MARRLLITMFAVFGLANHVNADRAMTVRGSGVLVRMLPRETSSPSTSAAVSDWVVKSNVNQVVLHWQTTPFVHVERREIKTDAMIGATVTDTLGPVQVSPSRISDRTDLSSGDESASVALGLRRNGKVNVQLQIGIDEQRAVAGKHCANVTLTLTSH